MTSIRMQYRNDGFAYLSTNGGTIFLSAPTWRARRWALRKLKHQAAICGLRLEKKNGAFHCGYENANIVEHQLFPQLLAYWVSPTDRDLKKAFGFKGRRILDKGF